MQIIRERYSDLGPTLANEKLAELHSVTQSKETVRKLMMQSGLWIPRKLRAPKQTQEARGIGGVPCHCPMCIMLCSWSSKDAADVTDFVMLASLIFR